MGHKREIYMQNQPNLEVICDNTKPWCTNISVLKETDVNEIVRAISTGPSFKGIVPDKDILEKRLLNLYSVLTESQKDIISDVVIAQIEKIPLRAIPTSISDYSDYGIKGKYTFKIEFSDDRRLVGLYDDLAKLDSYVGFFAGLGSYFENKIQEQSEVIANSTAKWISIEQKRALLDESNSNYSREMELLDLELKKISSTVNERKERIAKIEKRAKNIMSFNKSEEFSCAYAVSVFISSNMQSISESSFDKIDFTGLFRTFDNYVTQSGLTEQFMFLRKSTALEPQINELIVAFKEKEDLIKKTISAPLHMNYGSSSKRMLSAFIAGGLALGVIGAYVLNKIEAKKEEKLLANSSVFDIVKQYGNAAEIFIINKKTKQQIRAPVDVLDFELLNSKMNSFYEMNSGKHHTEPLNSSLVEDIDVRITTLFQAQLTEGELRVPLLLNSLEFYSYLIHNDQYSANKSGNPIMLEDMMDNINMIFGFFFFTYQCDASSNYQDRKILDVKVLNTTDLSDEYLCTLSDSFYAEFLAKDALDFMDASNGLFSKNVDIENTVSSMMLYSSFDMDRINDLSLQERGRIMYRSMRHLSDFAIKGSANQEYFQVVTLTDLIRAQKWLDAETKLFSKYTDPDFIAKNSEDPVFKFLGINQDDIKRAKAASDILRDYVTNEALAKYDGESQ